MTDLTGQQEELNIEGVETCYAHKVKPLFYCKRISSKSFVIPHNLPQS